MSEHAVPARSGSTRSETLERLERARDRLERVEAEIEVAGGEDVEQAAEAYRTASRLLETYVDRATGTGREQFKAYVQLEGQFAALVENLPDGLTDRAAFENALEAIDKRRLSESDFERAESALEPAARYAELIDEREEARETLRQARIDASDRRRTLDDEIADCERLLDLAEADLDAPVERLRDPIERYNETIREAFAAYQLEAPAREVVSLLERSQWYPFVDLERPPADLREYILTREAGSYSIPKLLEFAAYSRSKLDHYVADPDLLKRQVATQQTFLDSIDAEALTIAWPPGPAPLLRRQVRERRPFVERVADEAAVADLRSIAELTYGEEFDRLQTAAQAVSKLTPDQRARLADGRVAADLETLREERSALEEALEVADPV